MTTWALFVKVNDKCSFAGFETLEEWVTEFEERVAEDVELTKDLDVKTQASKVVCVDD